MKTTRNFRTIARTGFTAVALFIAGTSMNANDAESMTAFEKLEKLNISVDETIRYKAPESAEVETLIYDEATSRLEVINAGIDEMIRYKAPESVEL
jgi:hypothetical protein